MANLYSRYESGTQFTAGTIAGSSLGTSGLNPIVDRLNSVAPAGSMLSGVGLVIYASGGNLLGGAQTQYLSINHAAFKGDNDSDANVYNAYFLQLADASTIVAGLTLPHGATIIDGIIMGSPDGAPPFTAIMRHSGTSYEWIGSYNAGFNQTIVAEQNQVVDNKNYTYFLYSEEPGPGQRFYGGKITYTL